MASLFENRLQTNLFFRCEHSFSVFFFCFYLLKWRLNILMKTAVKAKKEAWLCDTPASPKAEAKAKAVKTKQAALKGIHRNKKMKSHMPFPYGSTRYCCPKGRPNALGERSQEKHAWPLHCHRVLPDHCVSHEEDRGQDPCVHCSWEANGSDRLWGSAMTLTWPRSTSWSGLMERKRLMFHWWLWHFGCCPPNWDHLNGVQLTNSPHKIFTIKKKNKGWLYL